MNATPPVTSIASNPKEVGERTAAHIELLFREHLKHPTVVKRPEYFRYISGEAHPFGNMVAMSPHADATHLAQAIAPLLQGKFPSAVLFPGGLSAPAKQAVLAAGYVDGGPMPAMAVDIARLQPVALPEGYDCVRVREGDAWGHVFAVGYALPLKLAQLFSPTVIKADPALDASLQFFAIRHGGKLVATSLLFLADGLAGVYCVSTVPEERGKGLGAYVTAEALHTAARLGYHVGILQSSEMGHSVYRRLGFQDLGTVPLFVRMGAG